MSALPKAKPLTIPAPKSVDVDDLADVKGGIAVFPLDDGTVMLCRIDSGQVEWSQLLYPEQAEYIAQMLADAAVKARVKVAS